MMLNAYRKPLYRVVYKHVHGFLYNVYDGDISYFNVSILITWNDNEATADR